MRDHLSFRPAAPSDESLVLDIFTRSPGYFLRVEGGPPTPEIVRNEMYGLPQTAQPFHRKEFLILERNGLPAGTVELHLHHPDEDTAYIGLFLLTENLHGQGWGKRFYKSVEDYCLNTHNIKKIKIGISDDNDVSPFWQKLGFAPNGREYSFQGVNKITYSREYERHLA
jgi:RimJ/RimL family protein N-acetyltransferase